MIEIESCMLQTNYTMHLPKSRTTLKIEVIFDPLRIDKNRAAQILVNSFVTEYRQYMQPQEIDQSLRNWHCKDGQNSVEQYCLDYFDSEFADFVLGKLFWVQASIADELCGWITYEKQSNSKASYMNLLAVDPKYARMGIGRELVFSIAKLKLNPHLAAINLLLRKKNLGGCNFYSKLGFVRDPKFTRHNFVDVSLLEGWTLRV